MKIAFDGISPNLHTASDEFGKLSPQNSTSVPPVNGPDVGSILYNDSFGYTLTLASLVEKIFEDFIDNNVEYLEAKQVSLFPIIPTLRYGFKF